VKVLVCGGRDYTAADVLFNALDALHAECAVSELVHGQARGADQLAYMWGASRLGEHALRAFPAEWGKFGRAAGPRRNQQMLDEGKPDRVVAFPGGRGTADMVRRAKRAGIPVTEVCADVRPA